MPPSNVTCADGDGIIMDDVVVIEQPMTTEMEMSTEEIDSNQKPNTISNRGKRRRRVSSSSPSDTESHHALTKKKTCRRVSTSEDDFRPVANNGPAAQTSMPPRRQIVRRVSDYFDDMRTRSLGLLGGSGVQTKSNIAVTTAVGTRTPALITPSSSFLVGVVNPVVKKSTAGKEVVATMAVEGTRTDDCSKPDRSTASAASSHPAEIPVYTKPLPSSTPKPKRRTWKSIILTRILPMLILIEAALLVAERIFDLPFDPTFSLHDRPIHPDSVYVPGAGFSGFWFTLGRLRSISDPASKSYYCYSAGCLGVVATLSDRSMEEMSDLAFGVQQMWIDGEVDRYDVVTRFVDGLLFVDDNAEQDRGIATGGSNSTTITTTNTFPIMNNTNLLSKINIITTAKEIMGVRHSIRTPSGIEELRDMLIHTTWIPYATGNGLWAQDARTGDHHMDGAFSATTHPRCTHHLGLPFMMDLFLNILNVNLGRDKVEKFWKAGVALGL